MRRLFIAEKPSLAKAIADELGPAGRGAGCIRCRDGSVVTWCFGHLLEQAEPDEYLPDSVPRTKKGKKIWRLEDLPIFPERWKLHPKADAGAKAQLKAIKALLAEAPEVVHAGDPDREGQLLVDEVLERLRCRRPVLRFWTSAVDPASIRKGLAKLEDNRRFSGMRDAARGRARADWLLGMNLSRAYTLTNDAAGPDGRRGLIAVGRVQTPTLAMVARRDYAVNHFVPQPYFTISADLAPQGNPGGRFRARWKPRPGEPGMDEEGKRFIDLEAGRRLAERLAREKTAEVVSIEKKRKTARQPKCLSLADMQAQANKLYGMTADETLKVCQALYERHKILSYPRTDCEHLPESQHAEAPAVLAAIAKTFPAAAPAAKLADPTIRSGAFNDKKVTAHHAIIPVANAADWGALTEKERRIYRLAAKRYIAQFFPVHEYDETTVKLDLGGEDFVAKGRRVVKKGWKALYAPGESADDAKGPKRRGRAAGGDAGGAPGADEDDDDGLSDQALPPLARGDLADVLALTGREDQTKPPAYFTEGTLIAAMESIWRSFDDPALQEKLKDAGGIGTPATRAAIIQELKRKGYLASEKKYLHCTPAGRAVLLKASPAVRSAALTAAFEGKLQQVEAGKLALDAFVGEYEAFIRQELEKLRSPEKLGADGAGAAPPEPDFAAGSAGSAVRPAGTWAKPRAAAAFRSPRRAGVARRQSAKRTA